MVKQHGANPKGQENLIVDFLNSGKNVSKNFVLAAIGVDQLAFTVSADGSGNEAVPFNDALNISWVGTIFKTISLLVLSYFIASFLAI